MFVDTQIVSYAMKGNGPVVPNWLCCSIVANEFLLTQSSSIDAAGRSKSATKAKYYIPLYGIRNHLHFGEGFGRLHSTSSRFRRQHPFSKHTTDALIMEFGLLYPPMIEFGNFAMAEALNEKLVPLYSAAISFLEKDEQKLLSDRFRFLISSGIQCTALQRRDVETAFGLLERFLKNRTPKPEFRNTWNDLLILAVALNRGEKLRTLDTQLAAFAREHDLGLVIEDGKSTVIDCLQPAAVLQRRENRGTKGYVNSSWRVRVSGVGDRKF